MTFDILINKLSDPKVNIRDKARQVLKQLLLVNENINNGINKLGVSFFCKYIYSFFSLFLF